MLFKVDLIVTSDLIQGDAGFGRCRVQGQRNRGRTAVANDVFQGGCEVPIAISQAIGHVHMGEAVFNVHVRQGVAAHHRVDICTDGQHIASGRAVGEINAQLGDAVGDAVYSSTRVIVGVQADRQNGADQVQRQGHRIGGSTLCKCIAVGHSHGGRQ